MFKIFLKIIEIKRILINIIMEILFCLIIIMYKFKIVCILNNIKVYIYIKKL